jgi:hypothetical protein
MLSAKMLRAEFPTQRNRTLYSGELMKSVSLRCLDGLYQTGKRTPELLQVGDRPAR